MKVVVTSTPYYDQLGLLQQPQTPPPSRTEEVWDCDSLSEAKQIKAARENEYRQEYERGTRTRFDPSIRVEIVRIKKNE
jgi:hypothetical protein